jgi:hypothetical protein
VNQVGDIRSRYEDTQAGIDQQIKLWNFVPRNAPEYPYDQMVDNFISIISIPSSKASREEIFSCQKRIMGNSRVKSNWNFLRARFQRKGGPAEEKHNLITSMNRVAFDATSN